MFRKTQTGVKFDVCRRQITPGVVDFEFQEVVPVCHHAIGKEFQLIGKAQPTRGLVQAVGKSGFFDLRDQVFFFGNGIILIAHTAFAFSPQYEPKESAAHIEFRMDG